jgi:hypothetical protein
MIQEMPTDIANSPDHIQEFYLEMREDGQDEVLATMFALRRPPTSRTNQNYQKSFGTLDQQFSGCPKLLEYNTRVAKSLGYTPNINDHYNSSLAKFPGDPKAFVPHDDPKGHIKKVCEERGDACEGDVNVKGREPLRDPMETRIPMAADIVKQRVKELEINQPDEARKMTPQDKKAEVIHKYAPKS